MSTTRDTTFETGDWIAEIDDGPVVTEASNVEPGVDAVSFRVNTRVLREVVEERLPDDYPSVHVWADDERLAVCDHKSPIEGADVPALDELEDRANREEVVEPHDGACRSQFRREALLSALDAVDAEMVRVIVEDDYPLFLVNDGEGVAVAPMVREGGDA